MQKLLLHFSTHNLWFLILKTFVLLFVYTLFHCVFFKQNKCDITKIIYADYNNSNMPINDKYNGASNIVIWASKKGYKKIIH